MKFSNSHGCDRLVMFAIVAAAMLLFVGRGAAQSDGVYLSVEPAYGPPPLKVRAKVSVAGPAIDFRKYTLQSWYEDTDNETTIEDDGATLHMVGNAAKMIEVNYQITPNTVIEFDFRSDSIGEVHAIGFDNGTDLNDQSARRMFVLSGTEGWGTANQMYNQYRQKGWMRFRIPVGHSYQGRFKSLVFMNDHDVPSPTADGQFRNVTIFEIGRANTGGKIRWSLGEGKTFRDAGTIEHTYQKPGRYNLSVTVADANGRESGATATVVVKNPPDVTRKLFIDDHYVQSMEGAVRVVNRALKHPDNPIIVGDKPWDSYRPQVYGTVMHDKEQDLFRMWYLSIPSHILSPDPEPMVNGFKRVGHTTLVAYAESKDGVNWKKPNLGVVDFNGSKDNGLVNMGRDNTEGVSIVYQPNDPNPDRRYKAIFWEHQVQPKGEPTGREVLAKDPRPNGMWAAFSSDGLNWKNYEKNPVISGGSDTGQCVLYDPKLKKYVLYSRLGVGRRISRCTSDDFINWSPPQLVFDADSSDPPNTQIYGSGFCIYEGMYIGLPWMFYVNTSQKIDVQLIHSRDGIDWHRTAGRELVIPNGPEGAWDSGIIFTASQPVVTEDKIWIYYFGIQGDHHGHPERDWEESQKYYRGGIGLATLRRDGWVSLDIPFTGGHIITKPLTVPEAMGDDVTPRLILNTNAFTGDVKVTLLDESDQPIPGFEESANIHGDFLRTEVTFPGHTLAEIAGKTVKLKIHGRLAKVYSFWFE